MVIENRAQPRSTRTLEAFMFDRRTLDSLRIVGITSVRLKCVVTSGITQTLSFLHGLVGAPGLSSIELSNPCERHPSRICTFCLRIEVGFVYEKLMSFPRRKPSGVQDESAAQMFALTAPSCRPTHHQASATCHGRNSRKTWIPCQAHLISTSTSTSL